MNSAHVRPTGALKSGTRSAMHMFYGLGVDGGLAKSFALLNKHFELDFCLRAHLNAVHCCLADHVLHTLLIREWQQAHD